MLNQSIGDPAFAKTMKGNVIKMEVKILFKVIVRLNKLAGNDRVLPKAGIIDAVSVRNRSQLMI